MAHRGELVISRKAIAQGMSDVLRCPVCSCAHFLVHIAHEIAGAARIRHSLRPLFDEGGTILKTSGACVARRRNYIHVVPALSRDPYRVVLSIGARWPTPSAK